MEWIESLNRALKYIEESLEDDLHIAVIAREAGYSPFYLQRMFTMMTDLTLSEYVRARRLSEAGKRLQNGEKVLDTALRYGYESPESFSKAFRRFHGASPSAAASGAALRFLNPLLIFVTLKGGTVMDYRMEKMNAFDVIGLERRFSNDSAFGLIPQYWDEYHEKGYDCVCPGYLGICLDDLPEGAEEQNEFSYLIGSFAEKDTPLPDGFIRHTIPAYNWVKFTAIGPLPQALQSLNRQIFTEWLPNNTDYDIAAGLNIEMYTAGDTQSSDYHSEIWIPIRKRQEKGGEMNAELIQKDTFAVIGFEGSTEEGSGFIARLWQQANARFSEIEPLVARDANGSPFGFWGAMTDFARTFSPWEDGYSKGLYLAGAECRLDAKPPVGWSRWVVPAFTWLKVENEGSETFEKGLRLLDERGFTLCGAVMDYTDPKTGKGYMCYPAVADNTSESV